MTHVNVSDTFTDDVDLFRAGEIRTAGVSLRVTGSVCRLRKSTSLPVTSVYIADAEIKSAARVYAAGCVGQSVVLGGDDTITGFFQQCIFPCLETRAFSYCTWYYCNGMRRVDNEVNTSVILTESVFECEPPGPPPNGNWIDFVDVGMSRGCPPPSQMFSTSISMADTPGLINSAKLTASSPPAASGIPTGVQTVCNTDILTESPGERTNSQEDPGIPLIAVVVWALTVFVATAICVIALVWRKCSNK
jgi:hypothetical protein